MDTHNWDFSHATVCTEIPRLWYRYYYDARKRLMTKEVPGAGKVMMVYDRRDRLVLSQDARQRQRDEWSFTKYDVLNRPVMTGLHTSAQLQAVLDANFGAADYLPHEVLDTTAAGKANHLYTNQSFPTTELDVHSVTYYDNYQWKNDTTAQYNFDQTGELSNLVVEPLTQINTGQVTATKTKILGDSTYLTTVSYYDCRGRVLQTVADNHLGGLDRTMTRYAFDGLVEQSVVKHTTTAPVRTYFVTQWSKYDHTGRVKGSYQEIQEGGAFVYKDTTTIKNVPSVEKISTLAYNELGQLITKNLGEKTGSVNPLQTLNFRYNIRGWMTHLNDANLSTQSEDNDLFGFELKYAQGGLQNYLNGNIGQMVWKSSLDGVQRQYDYTYDGLNRLKTAKYSSATHAATENGRYDVGNLVYDLNGNIQTLTRQGLLSKDAQLNMSFGTMDSLQYSYRGNQLTGVQDLEAASTTGVAGDFRDGHSHTTSDPDYIYDANGNMIQDKNKEITSIAYNHLNLPTTIYFSGDRRIEYTYDAAGIKLKKEVYSGQNQHGNDSLVSKTNYVGSFVYEGDNLQFIHTAEGRALAPGTVEGNLAFLYEYHYKDHLGNLRVAFREGQEVTALATFETISIDENQGFEYDHSIVKTKPNGTGKASELGGDTKPLGAWKTLRVTKGDKVAAEVYAHISGTPAQTSGNGLNIFVQNLATNYNNGGETGINNPNTLLLGVGFSPDGQPNQTGGQPEAYLRYVLYDEAGQNAVKTGKVFVTSLATAGWEKLSLDIDIPENGILQIYTANESSDKNVWFDDLKVVFTPQLIVQENHYYPFGLEMAGINKLNKPEHRWKFQGQEEQKEFGLNWSSFKYRNADVALGRFFSVDPLAEDYVYNSTYAFSENNVTGDFELEGLEKKNGRGGSKVTESKPWYSLSNLKQRLRNGAKWLANSQAGDFARGFVNAVGSNNTSVTTPLDGKTYGLIKREKQTSTGGRIGQAFGDGFTIIQGALEIFDGSTKTAVGTVTSGSGVGVVVATAGVIETAHGLNTLRNGVNGLVDNLLGNNNGRVYSKANDVAKGGDGLKGELYKAGEFLEDKHNLLSKRAKFEKALGNAKSKKEIKRLKGEIKRIDNRFDTFMSKRAEDLAPIIKKFGGEKTVREAYEDMFKKKK
ncbi:hypothetical protein BKI52_37400 [marine bacterium AO1-C]|nr:hypothetical protein BKI52_37400 [marine bacterium AO1-C]